MWYNILLGGTMVLAFILGMFAEFALNMQHPNSFLKKYIKDGTMLLTDVDGETIVDINLDIDLNELKRKDIMIMNVHKQIVSREQFEKMKESCMPRQEDLLK